MGDENNRNLEFTTREYIDDTLSNWMGDNLGDGGITYGKT